METDKFLHVDCVDIAWSLGAWRRLDGISELFHSPACCNLMGFTDGRITGLGSLTDYCIGFLQLNLPMCR